MIWPCTLHSVDPDVPHPAPTSPRPWAFLFPTDISPLPVQLSTLAPGDAPPKKRGACCGGGQSLPIRVLSSGQSPFLPAASSTGRAAPPEARGRRKQAGRKQPGAGATLPALSPHHPPRPPRAAPGIWAYSSRGPKEKWGCHRLRRSGWPKGRGLGRVPDLAAGRRGPVPRCEAQWAWPSGPHDLHFAQKKARRGMRASGSWVWG